MAKKLKHKAIAKRFFEDDEYMFDAMIDDTGYTMIQCIDLLYDYKEQVFGEYVAVRQYDKGFI